MFPYLKPVVASIFVALLVVVLSGVLVKKPASGSVKKVAILTPVHHAALREIEEVFTDCLQREFNVEIDSFNAQGDRILLQSLAESILAREYDLVVGIATQPTIMLHELAQQRQVLTPILGIAVDDPVGNGLVHSMEASGNNLVAVTSGEDTDQQVDVLRLVKPSIKRVVLVYHPCPQLQKQADTMVHYFRSHAIPYHLVEIFSTAEVVHKVQPLVRPGDVILMLKDNMVVAAAEGLIDTAKRCGCLVYASDLNSGMLGADLAYGVREACYGLKGADLALEILKNNQHPSALASQFVDGYSLLIQCSAIAAYDLILPDDASRFPVAVEIV